MAKPKQTKNATGEPMHYSVGAVIENDGKYLLIDRRTEPLGFAGIAGHCGAGETPEKALVRKVAEESGLKVVAHTLLFEEEVPWNVCHAGVLSHYWHVYECRVEGEAQKNVEASKSMGWYAPDEMKKLAMEPVWKYWFEKLNIF